MPPAPKRPCRKPGCGILGTTAFCEKHTIKREAEVKVERIKYDKERGTSASRGYGYRWTQYSKLYRQNNPLCVKCEAAGKLTPVQCVDHIKPVSGPDDPLFYEPTNHQSLCKTCHSIKTASEDSGFGNERKM